MAQASAPYIKRVDKFEDLDLGNSEVLWAHMGNASYPIFLGKGLIKKEFTYPNSRPSVLITDENVDSLYKLKTNHKIVIPAGEASKSLDTAEGIARHLAQIGVGRDHLLIAMGGGVVGDLVGFVAGVYQRGVDFIQMPTSLVGQIDSAYGGKTGVNLEEGKNLIGLYHQPKSVIVDFDALKSLPQKELANGFAELLKTALIKGGSLWSMVKEADQVNQEMIKGAIQTKLGVVEQDERDEGIRQTLNLGHSIGHAIEAAGGYKKYSHGEAIAIGLLGAIRLSSQEDLHKEVEDILKRWGLPTKFKDLSSQEVFNLTAYDKKNKKGKRLFVLIREPGNVIFSQEVNDKDLLRTIGELRG